MDPNQDKSDKAMVNFFRILEKATTHNSFVFWRECFSQVIYPLLDDIQLALNTQTTDLLKKHYLRTLDHLFTQIALFLKDHSDRVPLCLYIDTLCLFIANLSN